MNLDELRATSVACEVDPDPAAAASEVLGKENDQDVSSVAGVLAEQLTAGVGLDAAVSTRRPADPAP